MTFAAFSRKYENGSNKVKFGICGVFDAVLPRIAFLGCRAWNSKADFHAFSQKYEFE
jgi:hypothetical protein